MILEEATHEAFSYYPSDLSHGSHEKILAACDDCGKIRVVSNHGYHCLCRSCSQKGLQASDKHPLWGKHHTQKTIAKMSEVKKGKIVSEETKFKISEALKGEKSHMWKGGISFKPYCIKFNKAYKAYIRELFGNKCFLCGMTEEDNGRKLDVHHVNYNKDGGCDGTKCICVPLCVSCHAKTGNKRKYYQELIIRKLKNALAEWL